MRLDEIMCDIKYKSFLGDDKINVNKVVYDSRNASEDTIFTAVRGMKVDGHLFIPDAISRGCKVVLCEEIPEGFSETTFIVVENSRASMADLSFSLKKNDMIENLVGVTGTNGKTSITYILKEIFCRHQKVVGVIGTMGAVIGEKKLSLENTTPEAPDLHELLTEMKKQNVSRCFMEVSSHATELFRVKNLMFKVGVFTNLTEDHLIFHHTMENYYQAKKKFFLQCKSAVINIDDLYGKRLYKELSNEGLHVVGYSSEEKTDYIISKTKITKEGCTFAIIFGESEYPATIRTPGKFNIYNYTAAVIAAHLEGIPLVEAIDSISKINGVAGRFEFLPTKLGCTIIVDFAHTPDGLEKVMETIEQFAKGRKIVLFGAQGERDRSRRAKMGEVAGKYCDFIVLTSDNPVNEDPYTICNEIAQGVSRYHLNYKIIIERDEAISYLIDNYQEGDTILLAGKSTEPYQIIGDKKIPYDEKKIAQEAIARKELKDMIRNDS